MDHELIHDRGHAQAYYLHEKVSGKVTERVRQYKAICNLPS